MNNLKPTEIREALIDSGVKKATRLPKLNALLAFFAGAYLTFAAVASIMASHDIAQNFGFGISKIVTAIVFCLALILILIAGAELFTGNALIVMSVMARKITVKDLLKNWIVVYIFNFVGAVFVAYLVHISGVWGSNGGKAADVALKIAKAKVSMPFVQAFVRAILANWLVCLAIWVATSARSVWGKIVSALAIIPPFVISGYEHSIANMSYIPIGIMLKGTSYVSGANLGDLSVINIKNMMLSNLLPVTLGNIVGGGLFVGALYFMAYAQKKKSIA